MKKKNIRWAICGLGRIAGVFAETAGRSGSIVTACAGKDRGNTQDFAARYGLSPVFGYNELAERADVDAVYISNYTSDHYETAKAMLAGGKAVLCEKSITETKDEAKELYAIAKETKTLLMEAMWMRFLPAVNKVLELTRGGAIGKITGYSCIFALPFAEGHRIFDSSRGGGVSLDIGVYAVSMGQAVCGSPKKYNTASVFRGGVDVAGSYQIEYKSGATGNIILSALAGTREEFTIVGEEGIIEIPAFHAASALTLVKGGERTEYDFSDCAVDFSYEIKHFEALMSRGAYASGIWTPKDSVEVMGVLTKARLN